MTIPRLIFAASLCLPFCFNVPLPAQPAPEAPAGKRVAFLVGVNEYDKPGFDKLDYAERDVEELAKVFKDLLKFDEVVLVKGNAATRQGIEEKLTKLVKSLGRNDLCVAALSGHGLQFEIAEGKEEAFFCPVDAVCPKRNEPAGQKNKGDKLYSMKELTGLLQQNAGTNLLLVDACRSEPPLDGKGAKGVEGVDDYPVEQRMAIFFSCSARQRAWENKNAGGGHSVFTWCVLEGLRGGAKDMDGEITWLGLVKYVDKAMKRDETKKMLFKPQVPALSTKVSSDVLLARLEGGVKIEAKVEKKEPKPGEERVFDVGNGVKMTFCWIPGTNGKATLGSPKGEDKRSDHEAEHEVELDGFWMAKTEMTQAQYVKLTGKKNPSFFCADGKGKASVNGKNTDDFPVETVSWNDAQECIKEMKVPSGMKRIGLPSEAQWEWACRGGKGNGIAFYFGDILNSDKANIDGTRPYGTTTKGTYLNRTEKVRSYDSTAAHPWGLSDMHGNVKEWCEDYYGEYEKLPRGKNPIQTVEQKSDDVRVLRGGSWGINPENCRSAYRSRYSPGSRYDDVGFRVVVLP